MTEDTLSDVLHTVRLSGAVFFDVSTTGPWVATAPPAASIAANVLPDSQYVIEYHVVTDGACWATLLNPDQPSEPVRLEPGSVIMFPQGDRHCLASDPGMRSDPDLTIYDQPEYLAPPYYIQQRVGEGTEETRMLCGFIGCDRVPFNPIIQTLPPMIHVPDAYSRHDGWLRALINIIMGESRTRRLGMQSVLSRLSELLFIEVVRSYAENLPPGATGWFAALADPRMKRALQLLHETPERPWTLEILAGEAGTSRTVLVNCFRKHLGVAPMAYLNNWRMQLATHLLMDRRASIANIALQVGYESEAAFSRSFKRCTGCSPGAWRKQKGLRQTLETI